MDQASMILLALSFLQLGWIANLYVRLNRQRRSCDAHKRYIRYLQGRQDNG